MKIIVTFISLLGLLIATPVLADKPSWAGKGGKPSEAEKEMHKEAMRAKGGAKNSAKGMPHENEHGMEHERREYRVHERDSKQEAERMKQQSPIENAHEAVHDAAQAHDTVQNAKKWYEFWKK